MILLNSTEGNPAFDPELSSLWAGGAEDSSSEVYNIDAQQVLSAVLQSMQSRQSLNGLI